MSRPGYPGKRVLDVVLAGTALILLSPLLAAVAVIIRLETHGHPIYRQRRVGRGPTSDIWPASTLMRFGSSSIE